MSCLVSVWLTFAVVRWWRGLSKASRKRAFTPFPIKSIACPPSSIVRFLVTAYASQAKNVVVAAVAVADCQWMAEERAAAGAGGGWRQAATSERCCVFLRMAPLAAGQGWLMGPPWPEWMGDSKASGRIGWRGAAAAGFWVLFDRF